MAHVYQGGVATTPPGPIAADSITNIELANMKPWSFKARNNSVSGDPEDINLADVTEELTPASGDFLLGFLATGEIRTFDIGNLPGGGGGGETNTGSNVNTNGVGVFDGKVGVDLQFRGINPLSSKLSVALDAVDNDIDIDVVEANLTLGNLGGTVGTAQIANSAVTFAKFQDISTDIFLGRDTAGSGIVEELSPATARTLLNVADGANNYSHPNHTGDVTSSGDGAQTIAADVVDNTKLSNMAAWTVKIRNAGTSGDPSDANLAALTEDLTPISGDFILGFLSTGEIRKFDVGNLPTGGGGEANTASNIGTDGTGVFDQKSGIDLQFRNIAAASTKISVTFDAVDNDIDLDVVEANLTLDNIGGTLDNSKLDTMPAWTYKIRNAGTTGAPSDAALADITTATPGSGDFAIGFLSTGEIRKFDVLAFLSGASQTPWLSDIDADGFDLRDLSNLEFRDTTLAPATAIRNIHADAGGMNFNVPIGDVFDFQVNGVSLIDIGVTDDIRLKTELNVNNQEIQSRSGTDIVLHSDNEVIVKLGDALGVDAFAIQDSADVEVFAVDSDGNVTLSGVIPATGIDIENATPRTAFAAGDKLLIWEAGVGNRQIDFSDLPGGGGSQTPWTSNIDADGFDLQDLSNIEFRTTTGAPAGTVQAIYADAGGIILNVPTGDDFDFQINGTSIFTLDSTGDFGQRKGTATATTATTAVDLSGVDWFEVTVQVATTALNVSNARDGKVYSIKILQDATGGREVTAGTGWNFGSDVTGLDSFAGDAANEYGWIVAVGNSGGGLDLLSAASRGY